MYTDFYGFSAKPFQLTPDPRFYFDSVTHRKAMAYLGYGLAQGEGFIVITGEIGAGKTTLVGHLADTIDKSRLTVARLSTSNLASEELLRLVAEAMGVDAAQADKAELLVRLEAFLRGEARAARRVLLIVDEAQNLSIEALEELRMLSNLQDGERALLQIFLLGQPEFRDRIAGEEALEQLRQRVIATHHLEPMAAGEVAGYLGHRLSLVGWNDDPHFDEGAIAALYRHSGGVPRKLNTLVTRVLTHGALDEQRLIDAATIDAVAADMATDAGENSAAPTSRGGGSQTTLTRRIAALESRLEQNEQALRRVLTLLVDWVERDTPRQQPIARDNAA